MELSKKYWMIYECVIPTVRFTLEIETSDRLECRKLRPCMLVAVTTGMREAKSPSTINCYSFTCAIIFCSC
jgi:hypothetical protein